MILIYVDLHWAKASGCVGSVLFFFFFKNTNRGPLVAFSDAGVSVAKGNVNSPRTSFNSVIVEK